MNAAAKTASARVERRAKYLLLRFSGAGAPVALTAKEFDLLYFLASSPGQVFSRDQLMNHVWDFVYAGDASTVTVHIRRLREKIEADPERPRFLKTVWGVGYKFEADNGRP